MSKKYVAPLPAEITLSGGWRVVFAALDPTTGAAVANVTISDARLVCATSTPEAILPDPAAELEALPPIYVSLDDEPAVSTEA